MTTNNVYGPFSIPVYSDSEGTAIQSGIDDYGCKWVRIEVDEFAEQTEIICDECDTITDTGWLCLDGGEERCTDCIEFIT